MSGVELAVEAHLIKEATDHKCLQIGPGSVADCSMSRAWLPCLLIFKQLHNQQMTSSYDKSGQHAQIVKAFTVVLTQITGLGKLTSVCFMLPSLKSQTLHRMLRAFQKGTPFCSPL